MFYSFARFFFSSNKMKSNLPKSRVKKLFDIKKSGKKVVRYINRYPLFKGEQMTPELKVEFDKQINYYENMKEKTELMEKVDSTNYLKMIDSTFEGFFFKREYNLKNFNFYLQVLSKHHKPDEAFRTLEKMITMGIAPDYESYNHVLSAYARDRNIEKSEEIFELAKKNLKNPNKFLYNSLLLAYAKCEKVNEAESIIREMKNNHLIPDIVCYTTLIQAYYKSRDLKRCWEIFDQVTTQEDADETLLSYMIRLASYTHDSEKALALWNRLESKGFSKTVIHYNSIIFACSSRKDYAKRAIQYYNEMKSSSIAPDLHTFVGVLKACSKLGDINTANNLISEMKYIGTMTFNEHICTCLIKTYAEACRQPYCRGDYIDAYVKDSWEVFKLFENTNLPVNTHIVNSLLEVHAAGDRIEEIDGLVLPMYEKYNLKMNQFTYQILLRFFLEKRKFDAIEMLYNRMKSENLPATQYILNVYLEVCIRKNKIDGIVESLQKLKEINRKPNDVLLSKLGKLTEVPDRLYVELLNFRKYGNIDKNRRTFRKPQFREKDRPHPQQSRKKGRRYKKHKY